MLCLSGFELYSRWVPLLNEIHNCSLWISGWLRWLRTFLFHFCFPFMTIVTTVRPVFCSFFVFLFLLFFSVVYKESLMVYRQRKTDLKVDRGAPWKKHFWQSPAWQI